MNTTAILTGLALIVAVGLVFFAAAGKTVARGMAAPGVLEDALGQPYPAPEFTGITHWLNTDKPLTVAGLRGKVMLVDFWTYSCINCIRTFPYIKAWYEKYKKDGFVVVGVHTPEFAFEGQAENVTAALKKFGITYPVAMDDNHGTWNAFHNRYWPAHYLIDRNGRVVYTHFGEGQYDVTENNIRTLLGMKGVASPMQVQNIFMPGQTPETYLGTARAEDEWTDKTAALPLHDWRLDGAWMRQPQFIESRAAGDALTLHFRAKKVFLVLSAAGDAPIGASITLPHSGGWGADAPDGHITVKESRLYELVNLPHGGVGTLTLRADSPGLRAYAFTFQGDRE